MEKSLTELEQGVEGKIISVWGGRGLQRRLRALGFVEGQTVRKLSALALGGPVIVLINRAQIAIGRGIARKILISTYGNKIGRANAGE